MTALKGACRHGKKISGTQQTVFRHLWQKKTKKFTSIARQCKWPPLSKKIVKNQKFVTLVT